MSIRRDLVKQLPFITNDVAFSIRTQGTKDIKTKVRSPVPWIQKGWFVEKATSTKTPTSNVFIKDRSKVPYFQQLFKGGDGVPTTLSSVLKRRGILGSNENLVGSPSIKRNQYSNIPRAQYNKSLASIRDGRAFIERDGDDKAKGIYIKGGRKKITPTFLFIDSRTSRPILFFPSMIKGGVKMSRGKVQKNFTKTLRKSIKSIKPKFT